MQFVYYNIEREPIFVLVHMVKSPKSVGVKVMNPIILERGG